VILFSAPKEKKLLKMQRYNLLQIRAQNAWYFPQKLIFLQISNGVVCHFDVVIGVNGATKFGLDPLTLTNTLNT
jgi:hypothetical protein